MASMDVKEIVQDRILAALEKDIVPWQIPWNMDAGMHRNLKSGKAYRGINPFLLQITAMTEGFSSPYWLTYKQATEMGGSVKKGSKGTVITFWKAIDKDKKDPDAGKYRLLRYYNVFNTDQCEGLEDKIPVTEERAFNPLETAEAIIAGMPNAPVINTGVKACYSPSLDTVTIPKQDSFKSEEGYYSTVFHELAHSTGHSTRLNRDGIIKLDRFGSDQYGEEELIAEFTAAFLNAEAGIFHKSEEANVAYIASWKKSIGADKNLVMSAAGAAQKAYDHILGITWDN